MQPILDTSVSPRRPVLSAAASEPSISTLRPVFKDSLNPRHRPAFICSFCHQAHRSFAHVVGESARLTCEGCYRALVDLAVCWKCGELVYRGDACISLGWCFWHRVCFGCLFCGGRTSMQGAWGRGGGGGGEEDWQDEFCTSRGAAVELDEIPLCQHCLLNLAGEGADEDEIVRLALDSAHKGDSQLIRARYEKNKQATSGSDAALPEAQDEPCCQLIPEPAAYAAKTCIIPWSLGRPGNSTGNSDGHDSKFTSPKKEHICTRARAASTVIYGWSCALENRHFCHVYNKRKSDSSDSRAKAHSSHYRNIEALWIR
ncbi:hypothetical protein MCOR19_009797 [Pyricularia oryzae]|nr:hypothetical protein MCOR19_009797 [Pyricularia oryzae]